MCVADCTISSTSVTARARASFGKPSKKRFAAFVDCGLPFTWALDESPCSAVATRASATRIAAPHAESVRLGCAAHACASRSSSPTACSLISIIYFAGRELGRLHVVVPPFRSLRRAGPAGSPRPSPPRCARSTAAGGGSTRSPGAGVPARAPGLREPTSEPPQLRDLGLLEAVLLQPDARERRPRPGRGAGRQLTGSGSLSTRESRPGPPPSRWTRSRWPRSGWG